MHYLRGICFAITTTLLSACNSVPPQPDPNPQHLNDTPDLSSFRRIELSSNGNGQRLAAATHFAPNGGYLEVALPETNGQRLYVQVEECRASADAHCPRSYVLSGELSAFSSRLKCYVGIRNDANSGYANQALQGLCQDQYRRAYSITVSK